MRSMLIMAMALVCAAPAAAQAPQIQNGKVETRQASSIDREIASINSNDPVWVGWRVPMIDGERSLCCTWYSDSMSSLYPNGVRGCAPEPTANDTTFSGIRIGGSSSGTPAFPPPTGPVQLEGGTNLILLVRVVEKKVERVRTFSDDCPLDAGGRVVYWLEGVKSSDSLAFLDALAHKDDVTAEMHRSFAQAAVSAMAYHRDTAADGMLDKLAGDPEATVRRQAAAALGSKRGAAGLASLKRLIANEPSTDIRVQLISSIGQNKQPGTLETLRPFLTDANVKVRSEALYYFAIRGGQATIGEVTKAIDAEVDDNVKKRGVSGIAALPADQSVPALIQLAKTSASLVVKKEAVTALGRTKDPRAIAYLQELLK